MKNNALVSKVHVAAGGESLISSSGVSLLDQMAKVSGLADGLSVSLAPWRKSLAIHDPGKIVLDLVLAIAAGGDCLADVALIRAQPEIFGPVASDPTITRLFDTLAADPMAAITAIRAARAAARAKVWEHRSPLADDQQVIVDLDATLIGAHSEKELASPNYKRGFGFHPMMAFVDHGVGGTGEPLAAMLRTGRATANSAADQIAVLDAALAQLPEASRSKVLVRGDSGAGVQAFVAHVRDLGLQYSVAFMAANPSSTPSRGCPDRRGDEPSTPTDNHAKERWSPS